jgi:RNA polymerase sigma-70 factor, ECF subfamily
MLLLGTTSSFGRPLGWSRVCRAAQRSAVVRCSTSHARILPGAVLEWALTVSDATAGDEGALVRRALDGDERALGQLLAPHLERALMLARRIAPTRADAEDLVQDACIRAMEQLDRFTIGRPFGPWFNRVLINLGLNQRRSTRRRATESIDTEQLASTSDPHRDAESAEIWRRFAEAVDALPPRQRTIVYLFEVDGVGSAEIAADLGISQETVRWHLHAARTSLRRRLADLRVSDASEE